MGRPTKLLNTTLKKRLLKCLRNGSTIEKAVIYCGIDRSQYYRWMQKGKDAKSGVYRDFYDGVKKAEEHRYQKSLEHISDAMKTTWQAAAWYLERRHPAEFGKQEKITYEKLEPPEIVGEFSDPWEEEE